MRRLGEKMMSCWGNYRVHRLAYLFGICSHLLIPIEMHYFEPWVRSVLRPPLLQKGWFIWSRSTWPHVLCFSNDDLPLEGSYHTCPLYIIVGCSGHRVPFVLLDNGSALNVCPLATTITLVYVPSNFGPSIQTVKACDKTKREVMGTLMIELLIGLTKFPTLF